VVPTTFAGLSVARALIARRVVRCGSLSSVSCGRVCVCSVVDLRRDRQREQQTARSVEARARSRGASRLIAPSDWLTRARVCLLCARARAPNARTDYLKDRYVYVNPAVLRHGSGSSGDFVVDPPHIQSTDTAHNAPRIALTHPQRCTRTTVIVVLIDACRPWALSSSH
jgi:hypothetical protein